MGLNSTPKVKKYNRCFHPCVSAEMSSISGHMAGVRGWKWDILTPQPHGLEDHRRAWSWCRWRSNLRTYEFLKASHWCLCPIAYRFWVTPILISLLFPPFIFPNVWGAGHGDICQSRSYSALSYWVIIANERRRRSNGDGEERSATVTLPTCRKAADAKTWPILIDLWRWWMGLPLRSYCLVRWPKLNAANSPLKRRPLRRNPNGQFLSQMRRVCTRNGWKMETLQQLILANKRNTEIHW